MDPTRRLDRFHLGESVLARRRSSGARVASTWSSPAPSARPTSPRRCRVTRCAPAAVVEAGPNARNKRLIQHPYTEDTTHLGLKGMATTFEHQARGGAVWDKRAAFEDGSSHSGRVRPENCGPEPRPRPSLSDYLDGGGER